MSLITDQTGVLSLIHFVGYTAQSSGSQGIQEIDGTLSNPFQSSVAISVDVDTTENLTVGFNTYYKLHGFNPITQSYEVWHSMDAPLLDPPSGNALENITILFSWVDR